MQSSTRPGAGRQSFARPGVRTAGGLAAAVLAASIAWSGPAPAAPEGDRVAIVDGKPIGAEEFRRFLQRFVRSRLYHGGTQEMLVSLGTEARDTMIAERLLLKAAERRGIEADRTAVARHLDALRTRHGGDRPEDELESALAEAERNLLADSRIRRLRAEITEVPAPDEATLRTFYEERPELFTEPPAFDIDLVMLSVPPSAGGDEWDAAERRMEEIRAEFFSGTPFAALARQHSTHSSAGAGGRIGRVHQGQLPDPAQAAVDAMGVGDLSQPIRVLEGILLVRLNARHAPRLQPFERVRTRAEAIYRREAGEAAWQRFVAELHADAEIVAYDVAPLLGRAGAGDGE